jgi:hypothetical protein
MDKVEEEVIAEYDETASAWLIFAGVMTGLLGVFNIVEGLLSLANTIYKAQIGTATFFFNLTGWGWLHLLLGLALLGIAVALLAGMQWAPAIAVGLAGATAIFQMIYVNIIPTWSWVNVAIAVLIIFVLIVKGHDTLGIVRLPDRDVDE